MSEVSAEAIPNQYIVVFKKDTPEDVRQVHCEWAQTTHTSAAALRAESDGPELTGVGEQFNIETLAGYVGSFDENLKNEIQSREEVDFVEPDYVLHSCGNVTQSPVPSWGLARLSSNHKLPSPPPPGLGYTYDSSAGAGTTGYVFDTGILITHVDFAPHRASFGYNAVPGSPNTDKQCHGTFVAGIIGGTKYGVAKKCNLIAVKVLGDNGAGTTAGVIKGIEWAVKDALDHGRIKKSVGNMSMGGPKSEAMNQAVTAAVKAGLTMVVAAGGSNGDACKTSPASAPLAITVGSIDITDSKSSFSDYGKCIDLYAPGRDITSDWCSPGNTGTKTLTGTSAACAHVTGLILCLIAQNPSKYNSPAAITKGINDLAAKNSKVTPPLPSGSSSLIAFNGL